MCRWPLEVGFPGGASRQELACQCRRCKRRVFDPRVKKIPWRRAWQPTPVFLPGEFYGQRSLAGYSLWGCKESELCDLADMYTWSSEKFLLNHFSEKKKNVYSPHTHISVKVFTDLHLFCSSFVTSQILVHSFSTVSYIGEEFSLLLFLEFYCIALYFSHIFKLNLIQLILTYISNCPLCCNIGLTFRYSPLMCIFLDPQMPCELSRCTYFIIHHLDLEVCLFLAPLISFNLIFTRFTTFLDLRDLLQFLKSWTYYQRLFFSL